MKRTLITFALLFATFLSTSVWADGVKIGDIYYILNDDNKTALVTYPGSSWKDANPASIAYSGDITIPSSVKYNGITYSVTRICGNAFRGCDALTSVTIPSSITDILFCAFKDCTGLTSIEIPNSVKSIEEYAFDNCSNLTSVSIGSGVRYIGDSAFAECKKLSEIVCLRHYPPAINFSAFDIETYQKATLYIHEGTIGNYKSEDGWLLFRNVEDGVLAP